MTKATIDRATIAGTVTSVDRRGKQIFCFEGRGLHKVGRGETIRVPFDAHVYAGELIAISPGRAIVLVSQTNADHGVFASAEVAD